MIIISAKILISTEECYSLKEKRKVIKSIKERLRRSFNLTVAEVEYQDYHNQGMIGIAAISNEVKHANGLIDKSMNFLEQYYPGRVIDYEIDIEMK